MMQSRKQRQKKKIMYDESQYLKIFDEDLW